MGLSSSRNGKAATELDIELRRKVAEIEKILGYTFRDKSLLEEAITHGSYAGHPSYQRLEFVGDAVLDLAVSNYLYEKYPYIGPGVLTDLRKANVSNERLASVAVRLGLYRFLRHNSRDLDQAVSEFTEDDTAPKASKKWADMVESIAAAVYHDCDFDLRLVWEIFSKILKPFITLETMKEPPVEAVSFEDDEDDDGQNLDKQRLYVYCAKKRWIKPLYKIDKQEGPEHSKKFICSVTVGSEEEDFRTCCGDPEPKVKYAKNSAARRMLSNLQRPDEGKQPARIPNVKKSSVCSWLPDEDNQPARIRNVKKSSVFSWRFLLFFFFLTAFLHHCITAIMYL